MIKGATRKRTFKAIYRLLDRVSPVPFDCGTICGAACCNAAYTDEDVGIMLLPGEEKIHDKHADWLEWDSLNTDEYELPGSWHGKIYFVRCKTPPHCPRHMRPIQCRSFPLLPHLDEDGTLRMILNDYDLPYACPMIEEETELDERFVQATYTAWKHLIRDPLIYDMVWGDSRARDMEQTDLSGLSREEVEEELKSALLKPEKPSLFFEALREADQLDEWFPELKQTIGLEQDPVFHPEGDVWTHTMEVIDRAAAFRDRVSDPYSFMLLALTHDLGKIVTTEEKNGRIHAYGHETKGMPLVEAFIGRLVSEKRVRDYVYNMVPLHMRPNVAAYSKPVLKSTNRMFDAAVAPADLVWFAEADKPVVSGTDAFSGDRDFLLERLEAYRKTMAKPYVTENDLTGAGLEPGEDFSEILAYTHKLRLAGIEKDSALKQALTYARKIRRIKGKS